MSTKKYADFIVITLALCFIFCNSFPSHAQKTDPLLSRAEMLSDINRLEKQLLNIHPGLDSYESSRMLPELFENARQNLPAELNRIDFLLYIAPLIDATNCGHTGFNIKSRRKFAGMFQSDIEGLFPLQLKLVEGLIFIKRNLSEDTTLVKDQMQLLSIDGEQLDDVLLRLANLNLGSDGKNRLGEINFITKYFMLAYHMFYGAKDVFHIELLNLHNKEITKTVISAKSLKELRNIRLDRYPSLGLAPIQLRRIEGLPNAGVLDVNTFTSPGIDLFQLGYRHKMKRIFKIIEKENIGYLIVDLRNNPGGIVENVVRLMKYTYNQPFAITDRVLLNANYFKSEVGFFKKVGMYFRRKEKTEEGYMLKGFSQKKYKPKKKHRFDGNMIILIDEGSFSAACTYALQAKSNNRALLLGGEAGGSYHIVSAGDSHNCKLKNAQLTVRIPIMRYVYNVDESRQDRLNGVVPDIVTHISISDFIKGIDTQMQAAMNILQKHQQKVKD